MGITLRTHKRLWGDSGNLCAKCKSRVVEDATDMDDASLVAEEAHIVSKETNGPRYNDPLPMDQRDEFENLLILCNRCHKIVDDQVNTYTVEVLRRMKRDHGDEVFAKLRGQPSGQESISSQSSRVSSIGWQIPFPANPSGKGIDPGLLDTFDENLHQDIVRCFAHTCITTGIEDFVYLLTFAEAEEVSDPRFVVMDFELDCHVTEFVMTLEERLLYACGLRQKPPPPLRSLRGDQTTQLRRRYGRDLAHRIYRVPPSGVVIEQVDGLPCPPGRSMTTSHFLCLVAGALKHKTLIWDNADQYPDISKVMTAIDRINQAGFSWRNVRLDPRDPEKWEYIG